MLTSKYDKLHTYSKEEIENNSNKNDKKEKEKMFSKNKWVFEGYTESYRMTKMRFYLSILYIIGNRYLAVIFQLHKLHGQT